VSSENDYLLLKTVPSPDGRENPFVVGFTIKDWKDSRNQLLNFNQILNCSNIQYISTYYTYILDIKINPTV
jgi:hypothetical protein